MFDINAMIDKLTADTMDNIEKMRVEDPEKYEEVKDLLLNN